MHRIITKKLPSGNRRTRTSALVGKAGDVVRGTMKKAVQPLGNAHLVRRNGGVRGLPTASKMSKRLKNFQDISNNEYLNQITG
jgi:hypothetical protein